MTIRHIAYSLLAVSLLVAFLLLADIRTRNIDRVARCVVATAKAQGYVGNPYSRHAWVTFAPDCK